MKRLLILAALCLAATPVNALTLPELRQEALTTRHTVKAFEAQAAIAEKKVTEARSPFLPSVDVEYSANRYNHDTLTGEKEENDCYTGSVSVNLFSGFSDLYRLKAAKSGASAGRLDLKAARQEISHRVSLAYLGLYRSRQNLAVAEDSARLYRDRYRQMRLKYDVGVLKKRDLLNVKVEMDNAIQEERRSQAATTAALNILALEVGRPLSLSEATDLDFTLFQETAPSLDTAKAKVRLISVNSGILSLKKALASAAMEKKATKGAYMPRLDLSATYRSLYLDDYSFGSATTTGDDLRLTATVSMNLFDGLKREALISQSSLREESLRHQIIEEENSLTTDFDNAILDRDVAVDNLTVAETGLTAATENLRITDLAFEQGLATSTEVLDAIFSLSRARFNRITAQADLFSTHFTLIRLTDGY